MRFDPHTLVEGCLVAGFAMGCTAAYIYIRGEFPLECKNLQTAIDEAYAAGMLGPRACGGAFSFDLEVRLGAGAYICGEETSMLESLEGKRGMIRPKPPIPALEGLFGKPTIINNVLSFAAVPDILSRGPEFYKNYGMGRSRGTLPFQLAGNIKRGGLVEKAFGITLRELLEDFGGGTHSGRPARAIQVGGPLGSYVPASQFDLPMDYETFAANGAMVGHGGLVVFDDTVDMARQARFAMEFCAIESCGKCTPCRIGAVRGVEVIDRIIAGVERDKNLIVLDDLCQTMVEGSLCAMGGLTPMPVQSAIKHFPEDFDRPPVAKAAE
jgi:formate dehydrogenase iron-sulfur subunit